MQSSDLFSHPDEPERVTIERRSEPVEFPVFSDADKKPDSAVTPSPS